MTPAETSERDAILARLGVVTAGVIQAAPRLRIIALLERDFSVDQRQPEFLYEGTLRILFI